MVKKRGLGKSLDALLAYTSSGDSQSTKDMDAKTPSEALYQIAVSDIQGGKYQPRREMDPQALEELASSIRQQGIIQPLIVRPLSDKPHRYEIVAGERRWRAAKMAGLHEVPAIVRHIPDETAIAMALIENIQRENLNPIEEAIALDRLIKEFGMTHQQIAETLSKSRTSVTNLLRLLILPESIKSMLERGLLEMGHARALITLPESSQVEIADIIVARKLSVRETENLVRRLQSARSEPKKRSIDSDLLDAQESLTKQLKLPVAIQCNAKGKGKLIIHYRNLNELNKLIAQIQTE